MKINIKSLFFTTLIFYNISIVCAVNTPDAPQTLPPLPIIENNTNTTLDEQNNSSQTHQTKSSSILQRIKNIFKSNKQDSKKSSSVVKDDHLVENTSKDKTLPQLPQIPDIQHLSINQIASEANALIANKDSTKSLQNDSSKQPTASPVSFLAQQPAKSTSAPLLSQSAIQERQIPAPATAANTNSASSTLTITNSDKINDIKRVEEPKIIIQQPQSTGIDKLKAAMSKASTAALQQETEATNKIKTQVTSDLAAIQKPAPLPIVLQASSSVSNTINNQGNINTSNDDAIFSPNDDNDMSGLQAQFITNEAKVLLLPNDDIVLGQLSPSAKIENTDFLTYINMLDQQNEQANSQNDRLIKNFILNYHYNFNINQILTKNEAKDAAFEAISQNNLPALRVLIDNYQILQVIDYNGNSLLHHAVDLNLYDISKFLLMRGVNITARNYDSKTALIIAQNNHYQEMVSLIKKAARKK